MELESQWKLFFWKIYFRKSDAERILWGITLISHVMSEANGCVMLRFIVNINSIFFTHIKKIYLCNPELQCTKFKLLVFSCQHPLIRLSDDHNNNSDGPICIILRWCPKESKSQWRLFLMSCLRELDVHGKFMSVRATCKVSVWGVSAVDVSD